MTPLAAVSNPPLTFRSGILEQELTSTFLGLGATDEPHFYPPVSVSEGNLTFAHFNGRHSDCEVTARIWGRPVSFKALGIRIEFPCIFHCAFANRVSNNKRGDLSVTLKERGMQGTATKNHYV